jgi:hypothetical protein
MMPRGARWGVMDMGGMQQPAALCFVVQRSQPLHLLAVEVQIRGLPVGTHHIGPWAASVRSESPPICG